jgi:CheY-like chemotaxis protein
MDIVLAGKMDGIQAVQLIREKHRIPVVFITAYADRKKLERAKLPYPFGYLLKPFQPVPNCGCGSV